MNKLQERWDIKISTTSIEGFAISAASEEQSKVNVMSSESIAITSRRRNNLLY